MSTSPLIVLHICAGGLSLASGAAAMVLAKGEKRHRVAGDVFFTAMLCMSASGAWISLMQLETLNVIASVLTFYLVATGWVAVARKAGKPGLFDLAALLAASAVGAAGLGYGLEALHSPDGLRDGFSARPYLLFGGVGLVAALLDVRLFTAGGISGALRIARHLWRMCFAMGIATSSFFLGQQKLFPAGLRGSTLLAVPLLLVLAVMVYWLLRVLVNGIHGHGGPVLKRLRRLRGKGPASLPPMQQAAR